MRTLIQWLRCNVFHSCGGRVVSGWRGNTLYIGWCCNECGKVLHYGPTRMRR